MNLFGRKPTAICPYCFSVIAHDDIPWLLRGEDGVERRVASPFAASGNGMSTSVSRMILRNKPRAYRPDSVNLGELPQPRCPVERCGQPLPNNITQSQSLIIGLVGGPTSGKSHYLAALIERLGDNAALNANGCEEFLPLGDTDARYRQLYYDPLFIDHEPLSQTAQLRQGDINRPFVFAMTIRRGDIEETRDYTLVLFDASGEQIEREDQRRISAKYLYYADGLILFADPRTMEKARKSLPAHMREGAVMVPQPVYRMADTWQDGGSAAKTGGGDSWDIDDDRPAPAPLTVLPALAPVVRRGSTKMPHQTLAEIVRDYQMIRRRKPTEPLAMPVSLVIPKSDELKYIPGWDDTMPELLDDERAGEPIRRMDLLALSERVKGMVQHIAPPALMVACKRFQDITFHFVSATGCAPGSDGLFPDVEPKRVVDPFASILFRLDVIGV